MIIMTVAFIVQPHDAGSAPSPKRTKESCKLALKAVECVPVVIYATLPLEVSVPRAASVFVKSGSGAVFVSDYGFDVRR